MAIRFIVDSSSDILPSEAEKWGVVHVPLLVNIDGTEYRDCIDINHRMFYEKLIESAAIPVTSQVPPERFMKAMKPLVTAGDTVIVLALSSKLSGTYQSACIAAAEFAGQVYVVDTKSATVGIRLLLQAAMKLANEGHTAEAIVSKLEAMREKLRILAALDTLEYLKKGGRISAVTAAAGKLLSIKPVIAVVDGEVALVGKARGSKNSNNLLRKLIQEGNGVNFEMPYCVAYSGLSDELLKKYVEDSADLWRTDERQLPVHTVGSVIGTHVGPGAIAVAYFEL